ncbi:MAG: porin family protein [Alphaproteobacteria bacterium]|nr:porin family protein [Alphaproteobacteria bacterium]
MKKLFLLLTAFAVFYPLGAKAQDFAPYVSAKGVMTDLSASLDGYDIDYENLGLNVALGTKVNENMRVEFEIAYRGEDSVNESYVYEDSGYLYGGQDDISLSTMSYMINGYYDFYNQSSLTPYVGLGLGLAKVKYENEWWEDSSMGIFSGKWKASKTKMVWNVAAGLSYKINEKTNLDLGYRYVDYGSFSKEESKFETKANEFSLGVRFAF